MYRTVIVLQDGQMVSLNGTKDEVENLIIETDNIKKVRTMNRDTGSLDMELTYTV